MIKRAARNSATRTRRVRPTPSFLLAGVALFIALGGSAVAATGLIHAGDIAPGAVTSKAIRKGAVEPRDLSASARALIGSGQTVAGTKGDTGSATQGPAGASGSNGANGAEGAKGSNGANGPNGANGIDGTNGLVGTNGTNGTSGVNGVNGTVKPLSAKQGVTALPTGAPSTTVVELTVPAGNYVVLGKTELSHTGAGDSVECLLKSGATTIDQAAMKTLPALAATSASLQSVTTTTGPSTQLTIQCAVAVANGSANFNSLIAIPTA